MYDSLNMYRCFYEIAPLSFRNDEDRYELLTVSGKSLVLKRLTKYLI